jgi:hypothetical protein
MKSVTASRPNGYITIDDPQSGRTEFDTLQCAHCGAHWRIEPGSGRVRGFCLKCMGPLCGRRHCMDRCYPMEKQIDDTEKGKLILP